ncbi:charged multivesicular body protein 5 [Lophiotrema nucula]|uniref:Charged multivesicular body protein 5 n=1 Tax=Lophiotrema nucula TaxID=690887 RepID=A0A6A5YUC2_9PLEO|nr:charged multivesicular body protein 5 [Lophiotrema nucula]
MNRLFGAKSTAPKPTLNSAIGNVDERIKSIDVKLTALNAELAVYQKRLNSGSGQGQQALRQKALKVLQQRKMYEGQRDQLWQQSWNMEQAGMMQDNLKNTMITVDAMKTTTKELKKQYGKINIDKMEKVQDELADIMELANEMQEGMSRSYDIPEDVDEAELNEELDNIAREEQEKVKEDSRESAGGVPAFMMESSGPPQFIDEPPESSKVKEAAG